MVLRVPCCMADIFPDWSSRWVIRQAPFNGEFCAPSSGSFSHVSLIALPYFVPDNCHLLPFIELCKDIEPPTVVESILLNSMFSKNLSPFNEYVPPSVPANFFPAWS